MQKIHNSASAIVTAVALTFAGATAAHAADRGQALVQRNCSGCHAIGKLGASPNPNAPAFRELHRTIAMERLTQMLKDGLLATHPAMPEFRFTPREINAVASYLKSIQSRELAALSVRPSA